MKEVLGIILCTLAIFAILYLKKVLDARKSDDLDDEDDWEDSIDD